MPSLRDPAMKDNFTVGLSDKQVETTLKIICQATAGLISGQTNPRGHRHGRAGQPHQRPEAAAHAICRRLGGEVRWLH